MKVFLMIGIVAFIILLIVIYKIIKLKKEQAKLAEAFRKAAIEVINEHPEYQGLPEDLKILKVECAGLDKYKRINKDA